MAKDLTREYRQQPGCDAPAHAYCLHNLPTIVDRYLREKVHSLSIQRKRSTHSFLSPWYGWLVERLVAAIHPDHSRRGAEAERPRYESGRGTGVNCGSRLRDATDSRIPVLKSHVNAVVPDTAKWEQSAAYRLDTHELVHSFVKNAGLGFAIPYLHNGEQHEYVPDFIVRLTGDAARYLILETKGYDPVAGVKSQAAQRWVQAVNADGGFGLWSYTLVSDTGKVGEAVDGAVASTS